MLLTVSELAAQLGYSEQTIRKWADRQIIPCRRAGKRGYRKFDLDAVKAALDRPVADAEADALNGRR